MLSSWKTGLLPPYVVVDEPADEGSGEGLTPEVEAAIPLVVEKIHQEVKAA